jgi:hypothetical protein
MTAMLSWIGGLSTCACVRAPAVDARLTARDC